MRTRAALASVAALLAIAGLTGCTVPAAPEPTPTFAAEKEAFAAAEATYRAYVDAVNDVDLSDPETFEAVYAWTTGEANAEIRKSFSEMHADGFSVSGTSSATVVQPRGGVDEQLRSVELAVCLDVSDVQLVDSSGQSAVRPDRPDVQSMLIIVRDSAETETGWVISNIEGREGEPSCG